MNEEKLEFLKTHEGSFQYKDGDVWSYKIISSNHFEYGYNLSRQKPIKGSTNDIEAMVRQVNLVLAKNSGYTRIYYTDVTNTSDNLLLKWIKNT